MAFTEAQKLTLCKILQVKPSVLDYQISLLGDDLDSDRQTSIETEITRWTTAGATFTRIHPRDRNFGAEINPGEEKHDIRANIAILLELDLNTFTGGFSRLVRS